MTRFFYFWFILKKSEAFITERLNQRKTVGNYRSLSHPNNLIDFSSNDYLGFAKNNILKQQFTSQLQDTNFNLGSTGSRLLTGNSAFVEQLEDQIANFHDAEAGLIFNSGFDACLGLLSSLPQKGDTVITDELVHACIIDGCRLNYANRYIFKHNNLNSLEEKLKVAQGIIYVVVESIYSMDGDMAPLLKIARLCEQYQANLIVDEAHATGIFGHYGNGLVCKNSIQKLVFARVVTFGKAIGTHGAIVLGSQNLRNYLINFSRSFIYTTAPSYTTLLSTQIAYHQLLKTDHIQLLKRNISLFRSIANKTKLSFIDSFSAIQCVVISDNFKCKTVSENLQQKGFDVRAILSPTVKEGTERLRICLHSFNTETEIKNLLDTLAKLL